MMLDIFNTLADDLNLNSEVRTMAEIDLHAKQLCSKLQSRKNYCVDFEIYWSRDHKFRSAKCKNSWSIKPNPRFQTKYQLYM